MKLRAVNLGVLLSVGAVALSACSSDSEKSNFDDDGGTGGSSFGNGGRIGAGGRVGAGGSSTGGRTGTGGTGTGGGVGTGGTGAGGDASGGAGNGGAANGGAGNGGTGAGGDASGGAGNGGAGNGGAGNGGAGNGGAGNGGAGNGGTGAGGDASGGAGNGGAGNGGSGAGGDASGGAGNGGAGNGGSGAGGDASGGAGNGGSGNGGAPPDAGAGDAGVPQKLVFVTSQTWNGNLALAGNDTTTGLEGADYLCNQAAAAALLGGNWRAWLSDSTADAIDRINDVGPWYLVTGTKVFDDKAAIMNGPLTAINRSETGGTVTFFPWTGTQADGTADAETCLDWISSSASERGLCGVSSSNESNWTEGSSLRCDIPYNLYCFEQ